MIDKLEEIEISLHGLTALLDTMASAYEEQRFPMLVASLCYIATALQDQESKLDKLVKQCMEEKK